VIPSSNSEFCRSRYRASHALLEDVIGILPISSTVFARVGYIPLQEMYATNQKIAVSIPDGVTGIFH
jgi:hypothetical protein